MSHSLIGFLSQAEHGLKQVKSWLELWGEMPIKLKNVRSPDGLGAMSLCERGVGDHPFRETR